MTKALAVAGLALPLWFSASAMAVAAPSGLLPVPPLPSLPPVVALLPAPVAALVPTPVATLLAPPVPSASPSATVSPSAAASPTPSASPSASSDVLGEVLSLVTGAAADPSPSFDASAPVASAATVTTADTDVSTAANLVTSTATVTQTQTHDVAGLVTTRTQQIGKAALPASATGVIRPAKAKVPLSSSAVNSGSATGFAPAADLGTAVVSAVPSAQLAGSVRTPLFPNTDTPAALLASQAGQVAEARQQSTNRVSTGLAGVALAAVVIAAGAQIPARRRLRRS